MKRKLIVPVLAALAGLVLVTGTSAFKTGGVATKNKAINVYFQYSGSNEADANLQDISKWTDLGNTKPSSNPCSSTPNIVCVAHVDDAILSTRPGATNKERFIDYLTYGVDASNYVQANTDFKKP